MLLQRERDGIVLELPSLLEDQKALGFEQLIGMVGTDLAAFTQSLLPSDRDRTLVNMK